MDVLRTARLASVVAQIHERWGTQALQSLGDAALQPAFSALPTGFAALDALLSGGGFPLGQLSELRGPFGAGVATFAFRALASGQVAGQAHPAACIDFAQAFDATYAATCGVDLTRLLVIRPEILDDGFEIAAELVRRYGARLLLFDLSFASAAQTRQAVSRVAFRRLLALLRGSRCAVVCLTRPALDQSPSPLQLYCALCLHLRRIRLHHHLGDVRGCETQVRIVKQKTGGGQVQLRLPFATTEPGNRP